MSTKIPLFLNRDLLEYGHKSPLTIDLERQNSILIVGATGSGKTYTSRYLLAKIVQALPGSRIMIVDYKNYDFRDLSDCPNWYGYETAMDGLRKFNDEFNARLSGAASSKNHLIMYFDEWAAFLAAQEKKAADEAKSILSRLLMLGRAYNVHCIIGAQKAMAELFAAGSRDQFGAVVALGNLSKEQKNMLLSDFVDDMRVDCGRGQGHLLLSGQTIRRITVPEYNVAHANAWIRRALTEK